MSAPPSSIPVELTLATVLHHAAGGQSTTALLGLLADATAVTMGVDTCRCAVVLGEPDTDLSVHATSHPDATGPLLAPPRVWTSGPVHTSATSGAVSTINDVRPANLRWPAWAELARAAGVAGVRCWPVQVATRPVGALVVLTTDTWTAAAAPGDSPGRARSNATGTALADVCSVVLQLPSPEQRWSRVLTNLHRPLQVDVVVHQAVGMIAAAAEVGIPAAAAALAAHADRLGVEVTALAHQVLSRTVAARDIPTR